MVYRRRKHNPVYSLVIRRNRSSRRRYASPGIRKSLPGKKAGLLILSHYIKTSDNNCTNQPYDLIGDDTRVKDVFMLKVPTDAPRELAHLYDYQLTVLNSIRLDDEEMEAESTQVWAFFLSITT